MRKPLISVVINTLNEERNIPRSLKSVKNFADEVIVVDMHSEDKTRDIAREYGAKIFLHEKTGYVEPARNFALEKARGKWIFILDADEKIGPNLSKILKEIATKREKEIDYVLVPRKNIILGKWIQNSRWWPDYLPRFFKKGKVVWPTQIHQQPELHGKIYTLPDLEKYAIVHYNFESLDQFLERTWHYAEVQAEELVKEKKYKLATADLILKPLGEFLSRFFVGEGYRDGLHGLALALLQSYGVAMTYLKVWEKQKYEQKTIDNKKIREIFNTAIYEVNYWLSRWWLTKLGGFNKRAMEIIFKVKNLFLRMFS